MPGSGPFRKNGPKEVKCSEFASAMIDNMG
jgi:hypothetical protein